MSDSIDLLKQYMTENAAIMKQAMSEANATQEKLLAMQLEQAEKQALRQEIDANMGDAMKDTLNFGATQLMNWQKVVQYQDEAKLRAELGLPEEKDFIAEEAKKALGKNPPPSDYTVIDDDAADFEKEVKALDTAGDDDAELIFNEDGYVGNQNIDGGNSIPATDPKKDAEGS